MKTLHCKVSGMANEGSKTRIKNALDKINGVQEIAVDLSRGTVEVQYNIPADAVEIKNCIENAGYNIES